MGKCTVLCEDGTTCVQLDWPNTDLNPDGPGCTVIPPSVGQSVVVHKSPQGNRITQTFNPIPARSIRGSTYSTSNTNLFIPSQTGVENEQFTGTIPPDSVPGDRVTIGNQGQKFGLLDGGIALLSASPWSAVRCIQEEDTTHVFGRNLLVRTGMGDLAFFDESGKTGVSFVGGTDKLTETGYGADNPTVFFNIGKNAPGLMNLRFTNTTGNVIFNQELANNGDRTEFSAGSWGRTVSGHETVHLGGGRYVKIAEGQDVLNIENGDYSLTVKGGGYFQTTQGFNIQSGGDFDVNSMRGISMNAGTSFRASIGPGVPLGGLIELINNDPNPLAAINLQTMNMIDSVKLGSLPGGVAPFHACMFEQLSTLMIALFAWLDGHTHGTGVGPSSPPIPSTPIPSGPLAAAMATNLALVRSLKVAIGA